jgi:spore germination protein YaaH
LFLYTYIHSLPNLVDRQVWYDDAESLSWKYKLAREMGLRGVGPYTFDDVRGMMMMM